MPEMLFVTFTCQQFCMPNQFFKNHTLGKNSSVRIHKVFKSKFKCRILILKYKSVTENLMKKIVCSLNDAEEKWQFSWWVNGKNQVTFHKKKMAHETYFNQRTEGFKLKISPHVSHEQKKKEENGSKTFGARRLVFYMLFYQSSQ